GRGQVTNVIDVEHQQRAAFRFLQHLLGAPKPVAMQAAVVDAFLEVDAHGAERGQRPPPVVARVDVFGADLQRIARSLVHGCLLYAVSIAALAPASSADYRPGRLRGPAVRIDIIAAGPPTAITPSAVASLRRRISMSICLDLGILNHGTPDFSFLLDKCGRLGWRAAGGAQ